jgi:hypothetical protein
MTPQQSWALIEEYLRVEDDLEAILNLPQGVEKSSKWCDTVRWLRNRLSELKNTLYPEKSA